LLPLAAPRIPEPAAAAQTAFAAEQVVAARVSQLLETLTSLGQAREIERGKFVA